jgi:hypothetical protein
MKYPPRASPQATNIPTTIASLKLRSLMTTPCFANDLLPAYPNIRSALCLECMHMHVKM